MQSACRVAYAERFCRYWKCPVRAPDKCRTKFEFQWPVAVGRATGQPPEIPSVCTREHTREKDLRFNSNHWIFITFAQVQLLWCPPHFSLWVRRLPKQLSII